MSVSQYRNDFAGPMKTLRIIILAMVMGVFMFGAVAVFVRVGASNDASVAGDGIPILTYIALAFGAMSVLMRLVVPGVIVSASRRKIAGGDFDRSGTCGGVASSRPAADTADAGKLMTVYVLRTIIAGAILEGACLLAIVAHFVDGSIATIVVAGVLAVGILALLPTWTAVEQWLDDQMRLLREERG